MIYNMIKNFKHKGLKKFFLTGSVVGIQPNHSARLRDMLAFLDTADCIEDMDLPGYHLHPLKGDRAGEHSITVSGNWRIVFEFIDGDAYLVNYEDYH